MRKVTRDQFYSSIGTQNVHPYIVSDKYPYTEEWKDPRGKVYGKIIPEDGVFLPGTYPFYTEHYYLSEDVQIVEVKDSKTTVSNINLSLFD